MRTLVLLIGFSVFFPISFAQAFEVLSSAKWGTSNTRPSPGGVVTYSFIETTHVYGSNTVIRPFSHLRNYSACFKQRVAAAFKAWEKVANIAFVEVKDNGLNTQDPNATGMIRIGATSQTAGQIAYAAPPPTPGQPLKNGIRGDIHFNINVTTFSCNSSRGIDIGAIAMHEIGHTIGLLHSHNKNSIMAGCGYQPNIRSLRPDDIAGARFLYGPKSNAITPEPNQPVNIVPIINLLLSYQDAPKDH